MRAVAWWVSTRTFKQNVRAAGTMPLPRQMRPDFWARMASRSEPEPARATRPSVAQQTRARQTGERGSNDDDVFHIVGSAEADPTKGRISNESPVGKALLGKRAGDEVQVKIPDGVRYLKIKEIH